MRRGVVVISVLVALGGGCSDEGGDLDAYCATARSFATDNPADAFARVDPADPAGTSAALAAAAERFRGWAADAPGEVRDDVEALAQVADDLAVAFEPDEDGTVEDDPGAAVDTEAAEAASARVLTFTLESCEVDLEPAG